VFPYPNLPIPFPNQREPNSGTLTAPVRGGNTFLVHPWWAKARQVTPHLSPVLKFILPEIGAKKDIQGDLETPEKGLIDILSW
jgi:hypothetical protein